MIVNGIFLISGSASSKLVYRITIDFYVYLISCGIAKLIGSSRSFCAFLGIF